MNRISLVICAYNEEKNIRNIIINVYNIPSVTEIIVINDGSQDETGNIIKSLKSEFNFKDIHLNENKGKGYALAIGVEESSGEYLVFIDADLSNLRTGHLNMLVEPMLNGEVDMVLGQATDTLISHRVNLFKNFSGQRALKKNDILPVLNRLKPSRFGVEAILNLYYRSINKKIKHITLDDLQHPTKFEKTSLHLALKEYLFEGHEILSTIFSNVDLVKRSIRNKVYNQLNIKA